MRDHARGRGAVSERYAARLCTVIDLRDETKGVRTFVVSKCLRQCDVRSKRRSVVMSTNPSPLGT